MKTIGLELNMLAVVVHDAEPVTLLFPWRKFHTFFLNRSVVIHVHQIINESKYRCINQTHQLQAQVSIIKIL